MSIFWVIGITFVLWMWIPGIIIYCFTDSINQAEWYEEHPGLTRLLRWTVFLPWMVTIVPTLWLIEKIYPSNHRGW